MIIARSDHPIEDGICDKIALFCDVEKRAVVPLVTTDVLYEVPLLWRAPASVATSSRSSASMLSSGRI
jgi:CTP synthase